jgi:hypothetical protein
MKTIKIFSVLSLAMIFAGVSAGFSKNSGKENIQVSRVPMIKYQVNVHLAADKAICNTYWVQLTDETGRLVAPAQIFVPGKNLYTFYSENKERSVRERGSKRVAMLVISQYVRNLECENNLFTRPDVKTGLFLSGETYSFDLFPAWDLQTDKN